MNLSQLGGSLGRMLTLCIFEIKIHTNICWILLNILGNYNITENAYIEKSEYRE